MRRAALALALALAFAGPALATGTVSCVSEDGASLDMGIGTLPILAVLSAHIQAEGTLLSTEDGGIGAVQAFGDAERILVDFTDENVSEILARLRLVTASSAEGHATAGTLEIVGRGVYAVICIGP